MSVTLSLLASIFYLTAAFLVGIQTAETRQVSLSLIRAAWFAALVLHAVLLMPLLFTPDGLDLAFFNAASTIMFLISLVLFFSCLYKPLQLIAAWVLPITVLLIWLNFFDPVGNVRIVAADNLTIQLHIITSLLAYSILIIAAMLALAFAYQNRLLHQGRLPASLRTFPPLDATEAFLFHLLIAGSGLLTVALISGWIYHENLLDQHLVHKTVLSAVAWLMLMILIGGRFMFGWREKKVLYFIIGGAVLLILAYFGSKLALEVIFKSV